MSEKIWMGQSAETALSHDKNAEEKVMYRDES